MIINIDNFYIIKTLKKIEQDAIDEVIEFAKTQNMFDEPINRSEEIIQTKVKQRLDLEGLSYDVVRPE
jgi:hypothetical protein